MHTGRIIVATLTLVAGCSRYEWRSELDVPGVCDNANQLNRGKVPSRVRLESDPASTRLRGYVRRRDSRAALSQALVRLGDDSSRRAVRSDSTGMFVIEPAPPGRYLIQVLAVGFHTLHDTIEVAVDGGDPLEVGLDIAMLDGPCSGFSSVRVRKPWWKFW